MYTVHYDTSSYLVFQKGKTKGMGSEWQKREREKGEGKKERLGLKGEVEEGKECCIKMLEFSDLECAIKQRRKYTSFLH